VQRTPLLTYFREPSRFLLWTVLSIALLAPVGLDRLGEAGLPTRHGRKAIVLAGLLVAGFIVARVVLGLVESRALAWLYLNGVRQVTVRDFPQEHYAALAVGAWHTIVHAFDPLSPGTLVPLLSVVATAIWWSWARGRVWMPSMAVACTALPLLAYGFVRLPAIPRAIVQAPSERPGTTPNAESATRTLSWLPLDADFENRVRLEGLGRDGDVPSYRLLRRLMAPNFGVLLGAPQLDGYENLMTREQALLTEALGSERTGATSPLALTRERLLERRRLIGQRWGLMEAAGVERLLSVERVQPQTWPISVRYEPGAASPGDVPSVNTFRLARPLPRVFIADDWLVASSAEQAAELLIFRAEADGVPDAVITAPSGVAVTSLAPSRAARSAGRAPSARLVHEEERVVELEATADHDSMLVLLDANAPGWRATVGGIPATILNANVAFRAVQVPAGTHRVRFEYQPPHWHAALAITGGFSIVLLTWLGWAALNRNSKPVQPEPTERSTSEPPAAE
jgi:hypothetical protein